MRCPDEARLGSRSARVYAPDVARTWHEVGKLDAQNGVDIAAQRRDQDFSGWALRGSNPRHPPCKGGALPTELSARGAVTVAAWAPKPSGFTRIRRPAAPSGPWTIPCGVFSQWDGLTISWYRARHAAIECRIQYAGFSSENGTRSYALRWSAAAAKATIAALPMIRFAVIEAPKGCPA